MRDSISPKIIKSVIQRRVEIEELHAKFHKLDSSEDLVKIKLTVD